MTATPQSTTPPTLANERRVAPRRKPAMGTICRVESPDASSSEVALVWNLSTSGISMLLNHPVPCGTVLSGYLELLHGDEMLRLRMTVMHVKQLETGDYFIGARFEQPLKDENLRPFVAEM